MRKGVGKMCNMPDMMEDMQQCQDRLDQLDTKISAILKYLKIDLMFQPESYDTVKSSEMKLQGVTLG